MRAHWIFLTFTKEVTQLYTQVVVWKRVKEINDELAITCMSRAIYLVGLVIMLTFPVPRKEQTFVLVHTIGDDKKEDDLSNRIESSYLNFL